MAAAAAGWVRDLAEATAAAGTPDRRRAARGEGLRGGRPRVAIVGTGVSGLVAAHRLHPGHELTIFEAAGRAGGHVNTVRVDVGERTHHVDTGFIVYNERNYPEFSRLLAALGVASQPSSMSFSVHQDDGPFEFSSAVPLGLYARPRHLVDPAFQRMLLDYVRFPRAARRFLAGAGPDDRTAMADLVVAQRWSTHFVERLLVPLGASIWSADRQRLLGFPARYVLEFFDNHGLLDIRDRPRWRTVQGGAARYVEALVRPFRDRIRLSTPVVSVTRTETGVEVRPRGGEPEIFDRVVMAVHGDHALRIIRDATPREREILGAFPYQRNRAVLHTDRRLLPRRRRTWASWNYHLGREPGEPVGVTYHMNRLQNLDDGVDVFVTLNREEAIDTAKVIARIDYEHPLYTWRSVQAQSQFDAIDGIDRIHYCGAYWGHGFHEDGVRSGIRAAARVAAAAA